MLKKIKLKGEQKKVLFLPAINPIQIKGVAGSGKTTVALYRAKHLLETQNNLFNETKIVIFTYNKTLSSYIRAISPYINGGYKKDTEEIKPLTKDGLNVEIINFHKWAFHFLKKNGIDLYNKTVMSWQQIKIINKIKDEVIADNSNILEKSTEFFIDEISWIKGKYLKSNDEYFNAKRTGRGTTDRVTKKDKEIIWAVYSKYNTELNKIGKVDFHDYAILCLKAIENNPSFEQPYTHIIVDEAQDLSKAQILTLSKLVSIETKSLSIIADAAQRIYKSGFSWSEVGINVRGGRTIEFKKNYRNTVQIAKVAMSLLEHETDKSEFTEIETALKGKTKPTIGYFSEWNTQMNYLIEQLNELIKKDLIHSTVILHRTNVGISEVKKHLENNNFTLELIKSNTTVNYNSKSIKVCTMSSIKGLEFNNVFMIDLNDDEIPYPPGFNGDNDEFHISTERRLLYTSITRARNNLFLLSSATPSRYLSEIDKKLVEIVENKEVEDDDLPF